MNKFNTNQIVHMYVCVCVYIEKHFLKSIWKCKAILKNSKPKRLKLLVIKFAIKLL